MTVPGIKIIQGRRLARPHPETGARPVAYHDLAMANPEVARKWVARAFLLLVVVAAVAWPRLDPPRLLRSGALHGARGERHSDDPRALRGEPENPFHVATFYRTGPVSRLLFLWDSGDCHLIHHLYATIPYYRIGRAVTRLYGRSCSRTASSSDARSAASLGVVRRRHAHGTPWPASAADRGEPARA